jgi:hypothetical protein
MFRIRKPGSPSTYWRLPHATDYVLGQTGLNMSELRLGTMTDGREIGCRPASMSLEKDMGI